MIICIMMVALGIYSQQGLNTVAHVTYKFVIWKDRNLSAEVRYLSLKNREYQLSCCWLNTDYNKTFNIFLNNFVNPISND
jgi:hypothetical protein